MAKPAGDDALATLLSTMFQAHPWHGVPAATADAGTYHAFIEIVPTDAVKFELDKPSGHLRVDRPQRFSSLCPMLYGFFPQTYCGDVVAARTGLADIEGDGDPLDVCVLTEKPFAHGNLIVRALPIGGLRMIDGNQADDKIVCVLEADLAYGALRELAACPRGIVERLKHYFLSYKQLPDEPARQVRIDEVYDRAEALAVIAASGQDYRVKYGAPEGRLSELKRLLGDGS